MAAINVFVFAIQTLFADLNSAFSFDSTAPHKHMSDRAYLGHVATPSL